MTNDQAVELVKRLPLTIGGLKIDEAPHEYNFIEALTEWIKKCKKLKSLSIIDTCVGGKDEGWRKESRWTDYTLQELRLRFTDLLGSSYSKEWGNALEKMKSLNKFECDGTDIYIDQVDLDTLDDSSTINRPGDKMQRAYYVDGLFPDGILLDGGYKVNRNESISSNYLSISSWHWKGCYIIAGKCLSKK
mmetsp:Transcript_23671/g.27371  ORF Transcript_23671/g.27371 Transcript_23671/m.27371 type:complete len:190 (+) Transcript_23671:60-629(+)